MSLLERVQKILDEKGITIKQAERESGLSNATIRKWATQNPSLDSIVKLAKYLQVSVDYLACGEEAPLPTRFQVYCDGVPLTESEADLVAMYRLLPEEHRKESFEFIHFKYSHFVVGGEKASIYSTYSDTSKPQEESGPARGDNTKSGTA
ncbi:hypothetical protein SDC9_126202 [bioreactor metagenome]|uniref:HTH cro/C1-type domain-containing protein n=1 Tax=bioreactor metagenome TaxID=1076179 RepID=A0A645CQJ5_9ZZZZ